MLVDDSSIDNFVNKKMIDRNEFSKETIIYNKAKKALEHLKELDENLAPVENIPSIIFLDLHMPEISGLEFIEKFGKLTKHITNNCKIVILTNSIDTDLMRSSNKNVIAFLNKPIHKFNFEKINSLLEMKLNSKMNFFSLN